MAMVRTIAVVFLGVFVVRAGAESFWEASPKPLHSNSTTTQPSPSDKTREDSPEPNCADFPENVGVCADEKQRERGQLRARTRERGSTSSTGDDHRHASAT